MIFRVYLAFTVFISWVHSYFWLSDPKYFVGFAIPVMSLWILRDRLNAFRPTFKKKIGLSHFMGILVSVIAFLWAGWMLAYLGMGERIGTRLVTLAYGMLMLCFVCRYYGWRGGVRVVFPSLVIWGLSVPFFIAVERGLSSGMQTISASVLYYVTDLFVEDVVREGTVVKAMGAVVGVDEGCSGIRSLYGVLLGAVFLGLLNIRKLGNLLGYWVSSLVGVCVLNLLRVLVLGFLGFVIDAESFGRVHDVVGWIWIAIYVSVMILLVRVWSARADKI